MSDYLALDLLATPVWIVSLGDDAVVYRNRAAELLEFFFSELVFGKCVLSVQFFGKPLHARKNRAILTDTRF